MIEIFQGRIGGGKTYNAVVRIASHLARGGHVFTNVELNWEGLKRLCEKSFRVRIKEEQLHFLDREQIPLVHQHISAGDMSLPVLVVVDEAQLWFNARNWSKTSEDLLTFLTQSRKVAVDVIFITQAATNIDKQFRVLCQYIWAFKDLQKFISWCPVAMIVCLQFDQDAKFLLKSYFIRKRKLVFEAYNTNALLKPIDFGGEKLSRVMVEKIPPFDWSKVGIWGQRAAMAFCLGVLFWVKGEIGL